MQNQYFHAHKKGIGGGKSLTFHLARHAFATTETLTNGVPLETVVRY